MNVRDEWPADEGQVRDVVAAAFGEEPVAELLDGLRESVAWLGLSYVAERGGEVIGHVAFTRGWLDAPSSLVEVLVLSPLCARLPRRLLAPRRGRSARRDGWVTVAPTLQ
ncbi:MAG: GNAT family N-acetyltransferase [Nocardioidaceae bacterium]